MSKIFRVSLIIFLLSSSIYSNESYEKQVYENFLKYSRNNPDSLFLLIEKESAKETLNKNETIRALIDLFKGRYHDVNGIPSEAERYLKLSLAYFESYKLYDYLALNYVYLGNYYRHEKDYDKSLEYYNKVNNFDDNINPSWKVWVLNHIGDLFRSQKKYDSAMKYYNLSLEKSIQLSNKEIIANNYSNIGDVYKDINILDSAVFYYRSALFINNQINDIVEIIQCNRLLSEIYFLKKDLNTSIKFLYTAINILNDNNNYYELKSTYELALRIYKSINNKDSVAKYAEDLFNIERKINKGYQSLMSNIINHESKSKELEYNNKALQDKDKIRLLTISILISISVIIFIILFFLWRKFVLKKKENKELQEAYDKINELNQTKDKFFSIIAHDLKGPVSSMKSLLNMIVQDYNSFSQEELLEIILEFKIQTDSTLGLLLNLLDWSRSQRGSIQYYHTIVNINLLFEDNISLLYSIAKSKDITIINELNQELNVYIDENSITTVIRNLISNAIKFSPFGSTIKVGAEKLDDQFVKVYIQDNGVGMTKEQLENLFDSRTSKSTYGTNNEKGTGLGLIIAKDFVENNFGKIWAESEVNVGTTFYFTLKLYK